MLISQIDNFSSFFFLRGNKISAKYTESVMLVDIFKHTYFIHQTDYFFRVCISFSPRSSLEILHIGLFSITAQIQLNFYCY